MSIFKSTFLLLNMLLLWASVSFIQTKSLSGIEFSEDDNEIDDEQSLFGVDEGSAEGDNTENEIAVEEEMKDVDEDRKILNENEVVDKDDESEKDEEIKSDDERMEEIKRIIAEIDKLLYDIRSGNADRGGTTSLYIR